MRPYYEFFCPVKLIAGHKALESTPFEFATLGVKNPMIITDAGVRQHGLLNPIETVFLSANMPIHAIFDQVPPDSSLQVVQKIAKEYREKGCDGILAVGGGSVIDTAKAVNILVSQGGDELLRYVGAHNLPSPLKPLFVIPTTAGTGSEVTMVAVVMDTQKQQKMLFASYYLMPNAAILDPRMTISLPAHLTAMTAMDALTHAIEAYIGMAHNPMSDAYAIGAIKAIGEHLFTAIRNGKDAEARLALAQASTMAGIAFSNSMVGLVHSLGHALGAVSHLPHGLCMNIFLPHVLKYNLTTDKKRIGEILLPLVGVDKYTATEADKRANGVIEHILAMRVCLHELTGLPYTLQQTNKVNQTDFDEIAKRALNDGSIIFNHREASIEDIKQLLHEAW